MASSSVSGKSCRVFSGPLDSTIPSESSRIGGGPTSSTVKRIAPIPEGSIDPSASTNKQQVITFFMPCEIDFFKDPKHIATHLHELVGPKEWGKMSSINLEVLVTQIAYETTMVSFYDFLLSLYGYVLLIDLPSPSGAT